MSNQKSPSEDRPLRKKPRKEPVNLSLNAIVKDRALKVAREMGYSLSEFVEYMCEKLHEERQRIPRRHRGDSLQLTLFDRVTPPAEEGTKKRRP